MDIEKLRHIFFDLDGTLIDSLPGIEFSLKKAAAAVALPDGVLNDVRSYIGPPVREVLKSIARTEDPLILTRLEEAFRESYDAEGWRKGRLYDEAIEVVASLSKKGYQVHILTNKPHIPTMRILDYFGLLPYIREVIAPEWNHACGTRKSEAAWETAARLSVKAGEGMLVGDSCDDAEAADACKFIFVAANYGYGSVVSRTKFKVHFKIDCLAALDSMLPKL